MRSDDTSPILGNLLGQEANLAADFGELAEDLVAQRVEAPTETRDCLDHQIEARAELLEDRANPVHRFVRHLISPCLAKWVNARSFRADPIPHTRTTTRTHQASHP